MPRLALLLGLFWSISASAQVVLRPVLPLATDPEISTDLNPHAVAIDLGAAHADVLYVHLVGSCGTPAANLEIMRHAAALGLHGVSLSYPNCPAVGDLAQGSSDPNVHEQIRMERLYGVDTSPLVSVARADSIENRLIRLLQYLDANFPAENWAQFLADGAPRWSRIIVGGHSQGSGHAGLLTKHHALHGALFFGGPGDGFAGGDVAPWVFEPSLTSAANMVGFTHRNDSLFPRATATYDAFELDTFPPMVNVDTIAPPYRDSHQFTSLAAPGRPGEFHGCVVVDVNLARLPDGTPLYQPVWTQMFQIALSQPGDSLGDMNCDGVTSVGDISAFVLALTNANAYAVAWPNCNIQRGDLNADAVVTVGDIAGFVELLTNP